MAPSTDRMTVWKAAQAQQKAAPVQAAVMVAECRGWMIIEAVLLLLVFAVNFKTLWQAVLAVVGSKKGKTA